MQKIFEFIMDFLKDVNNGNSYKRLLGLSSFAVAVLFIFIGKGSDYLITVLLGVATASAGFSVFERKV
ncbi:MAG: hypothetical protein LBU55_01250 [Elusimicrobiota bacterium]|jgi:hypothetical protein|nr:hypothetical protein [Elusimicrobiota bacterium]